jgi:hypothetical protein
MGSKKWILLLVWSFIFFNPFNSKAETSKKNVFHGLLLIKAEMERDFGLEQLECFPFIKKIGFPKDEASLIENCLQGAETLHSVLKEVRSSGLRVVGISDRFLRTGGFDTILIPWKASKGDVIHFLKSGMSWEEQTAFLHKINEVKTEIKKKVQISELYCSQQISNDQCLLGYKNLARVLENMEAKTRTWKRIVIADSFSPEKEFETLPLKFDAAIEELRNRMVFKDMQKEWAARKKIYGAIDEKFGVQLKRGLQVGNLICSLDLKESECLQGAANLTKAAPRLTDRAWNRVTITRNNTLIRSDQNAHFKFDLSPDEIVQAFSKKSTLDETEQNNVLAERLEARTKNNFTRLRSVCDLRGISSKLCVNGFENFMEFMGNNRDFVAVKPWETLMFVDGSQLWRVNFALNSSSRKSYIYIDAGADADTFEEYLKRFGGKGALRHPL